MIRLLPPSPGRASRVRTSRCSPFVLLLLGFVLSVAAATRAQAQASLTIVDEFRNTFSQQGPPLVSPGDPLTPGSADPARSAYDFQFQSGTAFGGWVTTRITSGENGTGTVLAGSPTTVPGPTTLTLPSGGGVKLAYVRMGRPIVSFKPTHRFGEVISRPLVKSDGQPAPANFYLPQPANAYADAPANTVFNPEFYFSPHAQLVYATQPGVVVINWKAIRN